MCFILSYIMRKFIIPIHLIMKFMKKIAMEVYILLLGAFFTDW